MTDAELLVRLDPPANTLKPPAVEGHLRAQKDLSEYNDCTIPRRCGTLYRNGLLQLSWIVWLSLSRRCAKAHYVPLFVTTTATSQTRAMSRSNGASNRLDWAAERMTSNYPPPPSTTGDAEPVVETAQQVSGADSQHAQIHPTFNAESSAAAAIATAPPTTVRFQSVLNTMYRRALL
jgi:hypothetical protein